MPCSMIAADFMPGPKKAISIARRRCKNETEMKRSKNAIHDTVHNKTVMRKRKWNSSCICSMIVLMVSVGSPRDSAPRYCPHFLVFRKQFVYANTRHSDPFSAKSPRYGQTNGYEKKLSAASCTHCIKIILLFQPPTSSFLRATLPRSCAERKNRNRKTEINNYDEDANTISSVSNRRRQNEKQSVPLHGNRMLTILAPTEGIHV